jgi:hypothetical protein
MIEETRAAIEAYCVKVGEVVYEWNDLHEKLAQLFAVVRVGDRQKALAKWYSLDTDRAQRKKLRNAVDNARPDFWRKLPEARGDLTWLLARADELAEDRHDAIHAPCSLYVRGDGSREVIAAVRSAKAGNRRAKNLEEKDLLVEFAWCAWRARDLGMFADMLAAAIQGRQTWPERQKLLSRADFSGESRRRG